VGLDTASRDETLPAIIKREKKRLTDARENIWRRIEEQRLKMKWSQVFIGCYKIIFIFSYKPFSLDKGHYNVKKETKKVLYHCDRLSDYTDVCESTNNWPGILRQAMTGPISMASIHYHHQRVILFINFSILCLVVYPWTIDIRDNGPQRPSH